MAAPPTAAPTPARRGMSKSARLGLGLLFTFVGLFLLSILLPTAPSTFGTILPVAAAGMVVLWLGGIFMGIGSRS